MYDHEATIDSLQKRITELHNEVHATRADHASDLDEISDTLLSYFKMTRDDDAYDTIVEQLDRKGIQLKLRERTYEVTIRVAYDVTVTVDATSEERAAEAAEQRVWETPQDLLTPPVTVETTEIDEA